MIVFLSHLVQRKEWTMRLPSLLSTDSSHLVGKPHFGQIGGVDVKESGTSEFPQRPGELSCAIVSRHGNSDGLKQFRPMARRRQCCVHFCARRHAPGLAPVIRVNVRVKWLWSAKPQAIAMSAMAKSDARNKSLARSMRRA